MKNKDLSMVFIQTGAILGFIALGGAMVFSIIANGESSNERMESGYAIEINDEKSFPIEYQQFVLMAKGKEINKIDCFLSDNSQYTVTDTTLMNRLNFDIPDYLKTQLEGSANTINMSVERPKLGGKYSRWPYIQFWASNQIDFNRAIHQNINSKNSLFDDIHTLAINTSKVCQMAAAKK